MQVSLRETRGTVPPASNANVDRSCPHIRDTAVECCEQDGKPNEKPNADRHPGDLVEHLAGQISNLHTDAPAVLDVVVLDRVPGPAQDRTHR